jgi:hypothetical protein
MYKNYRKLHEVLTKHSKVYDSSSRRMPHYIYPQDSAKTVHYTHLKPQGIRDKIAEIAILLVRKSYDVLSRYDPN